MTHPDWLHVLMNRRNFLQTSSLLAVAAASAGCGSDHRSVSVEASSSPPTLTPSVGPGAATSPDMDPGIASTVKVLAGTGGIIPLPDGTNLTIPAGALPQDTQITVTIPTSQNSSSVPSDDAPVILKYFLEPEGLVLSTPASLTIPVTKDTGEILAYASSQATPVTDLGDEQSNWTVPPVLGEGPESISIQVSHFTFILYEAGRLLTAYLVVDIPVQYLQPGDMLFFLTAEEGVKDWKPGHVASFVGPSQTPAAKADALIEANGNSVILNGLDVVTTLGGQADRFGFGHVYLGARRALDSSGNGLTDAQQQQVRDYLFSKLGAAYSLIGDSAVGDLGLFGFGGKNTFSCVSLCEAALRSVGRGLLSGFQRQTFSVPQELFFASKDVPQIDVQPGTALSINVYGVLADPNKFQSIGQALQEFLFTDPGYVLNVPYTVTADTLPPGATFDTQTITGDSQGPFPAYKFAWTPTADQVGQSFNLSLTLTYHHDQGVGQSINAVRKRSLVLNVAATGYTVNVLDTVSTPGTNTGGVNSAGTVAYDRHIPGTPDQFGNTQGSFDDVLFRAAGQTTSVLVVQVSTDSNNTQQGGSAAVTGGAPLIARSMNKNGDFLFTQQSPSAPGGSAPLPQVMLWNASLQSAAALPIPGFAEGGCINDQQQVSGVSHNNSTGLDSAFVVANNIYNDLKVHQALKLTQTPQTTIGNVLINDNGQVAGAVQDGSGDTIIFTADFANNKPAATLFTRTGFVQLLGWTDSGLVVLSEADGSISTTLNGQTSTIVPAPGTQVQVAAVNNEGDILTTEANTAGGSDVVLYTAGQRQVIPRTLSGLPSDNPIIQYVAAALSDAGHILCYQQSQVLGTETLDAHVILLTPPPA